MATGGMQPFFWGSGGQRLTPQEVERQRRLADAVLARSGDTSPAASPLAILSRPLQTLGGVFRENRAAEAERVGLEQAQARIDPLIAALTGGGSSYSSVASPVSSYAGSVTAPSVPSGERAGYIRNGLIDRGLQPHVADAFLLNFQDESGLNPDINEAAPIVPGSRGGYGLYQLTGPRRRAYEAYASERGVPTSDIDAQLDFLMHELQGPESRAAQSILGASNVNDAAVSIVRDFLRPAEEHRDRRIAEYMAYASPEDSAMAYAPQGSGISNADLMGGTALDAIEQAAPTSDPMVMALSAPSPAPVQVAQAGGGNDLLASILAAQADPWAQQQYGGMLNSLLSNELTRINQANDPLRQLQIQQAQANLNNTLNPWTARPAAAEELAPWGIVPQPGESWTFGQDGLPQQVYAPASAGDQFTLSPGEVRFDAAGNPIATVDAPSDLRYDSTTLRLPDGTERTFNVGDPVQLQEANNLIMQGAVEVPNSLVTVNNLPEDAGAGQFWGALGDAATDRYTQVLEGGNNAARTLAQLDQLESLLANSPQGFGAAATQFAGNFGIDLGNASGVQAAAALINQLVPAQRPPGSGPMSDADLALFKQSVPRLINQPGGNELIIQTMRDINTYDLQAARIVEDYAYRGQRAQTPEQADRLRTEMQQALDALQNPLENFNQRIESYNGQNTSQSQANPNILNGTTSTGLTWSIVE